MSASSSSSSEKSTSRIAVLGVIILAVVIHYFHMKLSRVIEPGVKLEPDTWLLKCGLYGYITPCKNYFVNFDHYGSLLFYDYTMMPLWQIDGNDCFRSEVCKPGTFEIAANGTVFINGEIIKRGTIIKKKVTTPYPFSIEPDIEWKELSGVHVQ